MAVSKDKITAYVLAAEARITALFALVGAHSLPGSQEKAQKVASATRKHSATVADYDKAREDLGVDLDGEAPPAEVPTGTAALNATTPVNSTTTSSPAASPPSTSTPDTSKSSSTGTTGSTGSSKN